MQLQEEILIQNLRLKVKNFINIKLNDKIWHDSNEFQMFMK